MQHVIAHATAAKRMGTATRRRKVPNARPPTLIVSDYGGRLAGLFERMRSIALHVLRIEFPVVLRADAAREDATPAGRARQVMDRVRTEVDNEINPTKIEGHAATIGRRVSEHGKVELQRQGRAALGIDLPLQDPGIGRVLDGFVHENVALISSLQGRTLDDLEGILIRAATGGGAESVAEEIAKRFDIAERHARLIARDQINKLNARITEARHEEIGVKSYIWNSLLVGPNRRKHHIARHGKTFLWSKPPADGHPGHAICCFPGDMPVSSHAPVTVIYRRWYRGESTELITDDGRVITSTPNHPILCSVGWKPAKDVDVGEYVIDASVERVDGQIADREHRESMIGEVFDALQPLRRVEASGTGGFHGDAAIDQDVDVVDINRSLGFELDPAITKSLCQEFLSRADDSTASGGCFDLLFGGAGPTSDRFVRVGSNLLSVLLGRGPHAHELRFALISRLDAIAHQLSSDRGSGDVEVLRDALNTPAVGMEAGHHVARVIFGVTRRAVHEPARPHTPSAEKLAETVRAYAERPRDLGQGSGVSGQHFRRVVQKLSGKLDAHVFNLQTDSSWYVARGLIVHNCQCYPTPVFDDVRAAIAEQEAAQATPQPPAVIARPKARPITPGGFQIGVTSEVGGAAQIHGTGGVAGVPAIPVRSPVLLRPRTPVVASPVASPVPTAPPQPGPFRAPTATVPSAKSAPVGFEAVEHEGTLYYRQPITGRAYTPAEHVERSKPSYALELSGPNKQIPGFDTLEVKTPKMAGGELRYRSAKTGATYTQEMIDSGEAAAQEAFLSAPAKERKPGLLGRIWSRLMGSGRGR